MYCAANLWVLTLCRENRCEPKKQARSLHFDFDVFVKVKTQFLFIIVQALVTTIEILFCLFARKRSLNNTVMESAMLHNL